MSDMGDTVELKFTQEGLRILDSALRELPYGVVSWLIEDINLQLKSHYEEKQAIDTPANDHQQAVQDDG